MAFTSFHQKLSKLIPTRSKPVDVGEVNAIQLLAKSALAIVKKAEDSKPSKKWRLRFRLWLKTFGLWVFPAWKRGPEQPKVAIYHDRIAAAVRCLIHILPISGVIALLCLNVNGTFVGTEIWPQTTTVLQFVAKLQEMLIVSSLAIVVVSYTHHHLTSDRGLPFGAALASIQVLQLNYLISPEFLGVLRTSSYRRLFKLQLFPVLVIFPLLIGTVGPASAACMIPRLGPWRVFTGLSGFRNTQDDLFPVYLDLGSPVALNWSHTAMDSYIRLDPIFRHWDNTSILWSANNVSSPLTLYVQNRNLSGDYIASTSIQNIALATAFTANGEPWTVKDSMDAFSNVSCPDANQVTWLASDTSTPPPSMIFNTSTIGSVTGRLGPLDIFSIRESIKSLPANATMLGDNVSFIDLHGPNATGIVYVMATSDANNNILVTLHPCTATLGWYLADMQYTGQNIRSHSLPNLQKKPTTQIRSAHIEGASLREMTPIPTSTDSDSLRLLMGSELFPGIIPLAISVMLTVTLSTLSGTINSDAFAICNTKTGYCPGYASKFKYISYRYGYGYGTEITSVRISLAILILYCLIAISHTIFTISTGRSSTAWDSISEFTALGLGSHPPAELRNTSAGIESAQVFEHKVRIAATAGFEGEGGDAAAFEARGTHLELVFASTEHRVISSVKPNAEYGDSVT